MALLLSLLDGEEAEPEGDGLRLSHATVAGLSSADAAQIGLPPPIPFTLFLSHDAPISDPRFNVRVDWFERDGTRLFAPQRMGTAFRAGTRQFLVLNPLFATLEALDALNAASGDPSPEGLDRRMVAYARFKEHLIQLTGDLKADEYLRGLTIHHATGLGIDLEPGDDKAPFLPALYGDRPPDPMTAEQEELEPVREPLLPSEQAERFQARFIDQGARRHFTLGNGIYTVLDAPVAAALDVVARINRADAETRQAFRKDPQSFLIPAIEAAGGDGGVICDLRGYGARVIGVGDWIPPKLSFPLAVSRQWFPDEEIELFTIAIPNEPPLEVRVEEIQALQDRIAQTQTANLPACEFNGRTLALSADLVTTIQGLVGRIQPSATTTPAPDAPPEKPSRQAALTQDNEEWLTFLAERRRLRQQAPALLPTDLKTPPKPHQETGIAWLQAAYLAGAPGVLLADDMGLGKTYQVLAFLRWLREVNSQPRQPVLVVAPKTLLGNWSEEIEQHLGLGALGSERRVFGPGLSAIKLTPAKGNDTTVSPGRAFWGSAPRTFSNATATTTRRRARHSSSA